jgi:hypothetical protein
VPQIRALYAQLLVEGIDVLPQRDDVRARLAPALIDGVMDANRLTFIEAAPHQALLTALYDVIGGEGLRQLLVRQTRIFGDSPLMSATIRSLLRLTGSTPHAFLRHLPRLRDLTVRDYGTLSYSKSPAGAAAFELRGYPVAYLNDANIELFRATFLVVVELTGDKTFVNVDARIAGPDAADFEVSWRP